MFGFGKHAPDARCGVVIDVGSASVAAAILISEPDEQHPTVVWTHTERCPVGDDFEVIGAAKRIATAIMNVSLELASSGTTTLASYDPKQTITELQVAIAAPWCYTVPKRVTHTAETGFTVDQTLLNELSQAAEREATQTYAAHPLFDALGLAVIASSTAHIIANGYPVANPRGKTVTELTLLQHFTICQKNLLDAIYELQNTVLPKTKLQVSSFMGHMRTQVLVNTLPQTTYGLLDISGDASEIGIVVNGQLHTVMSNSWGHNAIARELAAITNQPPETALSRLKDERTGLLEDLPEQQAAEYKTVKANFVTKLSDLIERATTEAELPAHYLLHTDTGLHGLGELLAREAIAAVGTEQHSLSLVSQKLLDVAPIQETRLALAAAVFHTTPQ